METRMIVFIIFSIIMGILTILNGIKIWDNGFEYSETIIEIIKQIGVTAVFVCIIYFIFM